MKRFVTLISFILFIASAVLFTACGGGGGGGDDGNDNTAPDTFHITGLSATATTITFSWDNRSCDHFTYTINESDSATGTTDSVADGTSDLTISGLSASTLYAVKLMGYDSSNILLETRVFYVDTPATGNEITFTIISDAAGLAAMADDLAGNYLLTADIDLIGVSWTPIGTSHTSNSFQGIFNGNGYKVSNLSINSSGNDNQGLFGGMTSGVICDLGVVDVKISGKSYVGALIGADQTSCIISDCHVSGTVTGSGNDVGGFIGYNSNCTLSNCRSDVTVSGSGDYIGGLVGEIYNGGTITNCQTTGNVSGSGSYTGGLVGAVVQESPFTTYTSAISQCHATGTVNGGSYTGGLVGAINQNSAPGTSTVSQCYATGTVTGSGYYTGGLMGAINQDYGTTTVSQCHATGTVNGGSLTGGLMGAINNFYDTSSVLQCYATGAVTGSGKVGGLAGGYHNYGGSSSLSQCYATGAVTGSGANIGGLVGSCILCTVQNCHAAGNVRGASSVGGLIGGFIPNDYVYPVVSDLENDVTHCYAVGQVSLTGSDPTVGIGGFAGYNCSSMTSIWGCFFDTATTGYSSGWLDLSGATGMTTVEMQAESTFTNVSWDFTDETANGSDDIWDIDTDSDPVAANRINGGYPYLKALQASY